MAKIVKRTFLPLLASFILLVTACGEEGSAFNAGLGEGGTMFSSGAAAASAYQVSARVGDSFSLENCSIIRAGDAVKPYFINSVTEDPDLTGLIVVIRNFDGATTGVEREYKITKGKTGAAAADSVSSGESSAAETGDKADTIGPTGAGDTKSDAEGSDADTGREIIPVAALDRNIPAFTFPSSTPPGAYRITFQVTGQNGVLAEFQYPVYYIGAAAFSFDDMAALLPDYSESSHLVPPGALVMLDAKITAGSQLNPYILWYNGKRRISEGSVSGGAGRLLWRVPGETGFLSIKAEVLPFPPEKSAQGFHGITKEISLPVSSRGESSGYFSRFLGEERKKLLNLYLLDGSLEDAMETYPGAHAENPGHSPLWERAGSIYGLGIGPGEYYQFPVNAFPVSEESGEEVCFLLRFMPLTEGVIFSASLMGRGDDEVLHIALAYTGGMLELTVEDEEGTLLGELVKPAARPEDMFTVIPGFILEEDDISFFLELNNPEEIKKGDSQRLRLVLPAPLSGKAICRLGSPGGSAKNKRSPLSAVMDEFAFYCAPAAGENPEENAGTTTGGGGNKQR